MKRNPWYYNAAFLLIELSQALIGLVTLTLYCPAWTFHFAWWWSRREQRKAMV